MKNSIALLAAVLALSGCNSGKQAAATPVTTGKSLAGIWTSTGANDKLLLALGADGTALMLASNDFAYGVVDGRYDQTETTLSLHLSGAPNTGAHYKWVSDDTIQLGFDTDPKQLFVLKVDRAGLKTASLESFTQEASPEQQAKMLSTSCLSNLKQLGTSQLLYAQDWDDCLPNSQAWKDGIMPYVRNESTFSCPTLTEAGKVGGYAMDSDLSGQRTKQYPNPSNTLLLFESTKEFTNATDPHASVLTRSRHKGGVSMLYLDGHVKDLK